MKVNALLNPPMVGHQGNTLLEKSVSIGVFFSRKYLSKSNPTLHALHGLPALTSFPPKTHPVFEHPPFTIGQQILFKIHKHREESV